MMHGAFKSTTLKFKVHSTSPILQLTVDKKKQKTKKLAILNYALWIDFNKEK